jgi:hypothetical protein
MLPKPKKSNVNLEHPAKNNKIEPRHSETRMVFKFLTYDGKGKVISL